MPDPLDPQRLAQAIRQALTHADPHDPYVDPYATFATPTPEEQALLDRIRGTRPSSQTVTVGEPLSTATLGTPTKPDFCRQCGIDLLSNPEALVHALPTLPDEDILVRCDCGRYAWLPKWLFE